MTDRVAVVDEVALPDVLGIMGVSTEFVFEWLVDLEELATGAVEDSAAGVALLATGLAVVFFFVVPGGGGVGVLFCS